MIKHELSLSLLVTIVLQVRKATGVSVARLGCIKTCCLESLPQAGCALHAFRVHVNLF